MVNYVIRRVIIAFFMLIGIGLISFVVIKLPPGDFATRYRQFLINRGSSVEEAEIAANQIRQQYGLDQPTPAQFVEWARGIVTEGKFGYSLAYRKDVGELIADRLPKTLIIAVLAHLISTVVGVALGIYVAPRKYSFIDNVWAILAFIFTSVPRFSIAIIFLYILVIELKQPSITSFFSPQYVVAPMELGKSGGYVPAYLARAGDRRVGRRGA
jgi:peptide/nickel transport system permease protein